MDNERNQQRLESVFSKKVRAGKRRTYFFDVRQTKGDDYYLTITESTKRFNGDGYERHKIFLYKEDFNRFMDGMEETVNFVKTELMPDYDYDEFTRRHEEWEARREEETENSTENNTSYQKPEPVQKREPVEKKDESDEVDDITEDVTEDDISW